MTAAATADHPAWRMSEPELADAILGELIAGGSVVPYRDDPVERLRAWIARRGQATLDALCEALRNEGERESALTEQAAKVADVLATLEGGVPVALLSIYLVRYLGQELC